MVECVLLRVRLFEVCVEVFGGLGGMGGGGRVGGGGGCGCGFVGVRGGEGGDRDQFYVCWVYGLGVCRGKCRGFKMNGTRGE